MIQDGIKFAKNPTVNPSKFKMYITAALVVDVFT